MTGIIEESRPRGLGTLGWGCFGAAIAACLIGQPSVNDWLERRSETARMAEMHFAPVVSSTGPIKSMVTPVATGPDSPPLAPYTPEPPSLPPLKLGSRKGTPEISFTSSYNITYDDIAVAVVTSSATIDRRLPILHEAWVGTSPFPVLILTDRAPVANKSFNASALTSDIVRVHTTNCSASLNGLVCKTKLAFQELYEAYPNKKWYLRLMDDTLVVAPNLLRMLQKVDPDKSWAVGDKIPIADANFSYFQGGGGWGLSAPALSVVREHWHVWDQVVMSGGDSPAAPGFTSLAAYSDDLLWGIFMANLAIPSIKLDGWSGAPLDMLGGILPCDQEISKNFCFSQTFVVGLWADGCEVKSAGTCRSKMEAPGVVHMGLEIWGGKDPWFEQMVELSRAIAESPSDLVGRFEDAPFFYWRLCSKSGRSIRTMSVEQTYREIYKQTMAKTRLEQVIEAGAHKHILSIGLCQEPRDVILLLPEPAQKDPNVGGVLLNAFDRHRDRLRFHTRPWVFTLMAQSPTGERANRSMQMVYRIGDDAYAIATSTCQALNMTGEPSCLHYAVDQLQSKLPTELHYQNLCLKHQLNKVDPGQYVIRDSASGALIDRPMPIPAVPSGHADEDREEADEQGPSGRRQRSRPPRAPFSLIPVASLVQQSQKEFSEKQGWHRFSVSAADVAVAVLTTSAQLPTRLPLLLKAWLGDSPFDHIVVTDAPPPNNKPKGKEGKNVDPWLVHVDCPAGVEGMVCKTAESLELLWKRYPGKKWYLRVTDTALIIPDNLLYHLRFTDPDQPWVLGDELAVELQGQGVPYLHGGPGWALNSAALKAILPHLDGYRGLVNAGERAKMGLDLKPLHDNLDDFYFGYMLKRAGIPLKRGEGWTAAPVDALTASQSCSKLLRTSLVSRQAFHIGTTSAGLPVSGETPVHVTLFRPAVLNAARVAESYAQDPHWLTSPPHLTLLDALRSGSLDMGSLAAGFDDQPYYYWRLCTMGADGNDVAEPEDDVIQAIGRRAAGLEKVHESLTLGDKQVEVGVHLCGMPWEAVLPLCDRLRLDDRECELVALFYETKRDELRQRFPPLRLLMEMPFGIGSLPLDYRVGDDPMAVAHMVCQGVNGTSSDVEACLSTVPLFIKEAGIDPRLRYDTLCQAYIKAHAKRSRRSPPPKAESKRRASPPKSSGPPFKAADVSKKQQGTATGVKPSRPADLSFIEAAVNKARQAQHAEEQEGSGTRPTVPLPVEREPQGEERREAPLDGGGNEGSGSDAASQGRMSADESLEEDSSRVLSYLRLGGVQLSLAYLHGQHGVDLTASLWQPLNHSTHHAGVIAVNPALSLLVYPNRSLEEVLHMSMARIEDLVPRVVRKCVALDGVTLHCLHSSAFTYNVWVKAQGTHTLDAWMEEVATGQRLAHTMTTSTFHVQLSPEQTSNPFFGHCAVPFTQRALLTGRLQRFIEDQGALNFDHEVSVPLTVFYRLSPRRDAPEHGLRTVTAATMSLLNNLRLLSTPQRRLTTLRVYLNGFSAEVDEKWRRWLRKVCVPLGLSALVFSDDCPPGNMASYLHMKADALSLGDPRTVVVLLEDDYLLQPSALQEMIEVFESHEPCVVIPYDGGERYAMNTFNDDDTHITVIAGRRRHWRTTRSTTVTFAARAGTLGVMERLGVVMHPLDDYKNSQRLVEAGASIVMPLPGLAAHVESQQFAKEPWLPLYFNYIQYANQLMLQAYQEGLDLHS